MMQTVLNYEQNECRKRFNYGWYFGNTNHQGERDYDVSLNTKNERCKKMGV